MTIKEFFKKITAPVIWGNLAGMAAVLVILAIGVWKGLEHYTNHGEIISVPDVKAQGVSDARYILNKAGLDAVIADSSYNRNSPPGAVLEQTPAPGAKVKSGHAIYLIINTTSTPTIPMPDIADNSSVREAEARLRSLGFRIGPPEMIQGEKDWVYGVKYGGRMVYAGDRLPLDARITLQVGSGSMDDFADSLDMADSLAVPTEDSFSPATESGELSDFEF